MIPDTPASKILDAFRRFDNELRGTADWAGWEDNRNHRYAILHDGRRYPVKEIVRLATGAIDFSGGDEANSFVQAKGFEIVLLRPNENDGVERIRAGLEWVLAHYLEEKQRPFDSGSSAATRETFESLRREFQDSAEMRRYPSVQAKAGIGQGNWAGVPWLAFVDSRAAAGIQSGVYVVLLFRADMTGVYLTLNQGVTEPQRRLGGPGARDFLRQTAANIRTYSGDLAAHDFRVDDSIDLRAGAGLGAQYESSTVAHKLYEKGSVPRDEVLLQDLDAVLKAYDRHIKRAAAAVIVDPPEPVVTIPSLPADDDADLIATVRDFSAALKSSNIAFGPTHDELVRSFVVSLATKRFVILTGLSGSGKTQLALRFGEWLGPSQMHVAAVRPDWTGGEALFGFEDALQPPKEGRRAWNVPEPLKFMLTAAKDSSRPYLLLLDEMNLAHVERYFADVLSGMESDVECLPNLEANEDGLWRVVSGGPSRVPVPQNLFVVGTVNVDETTYMFSPKVLDRANTFEFRVKTADLSTTARRPTKCAAGTPESVGAFAAIAADPDWHVRHEPSGLSDFITHFRNLHAILSAFGFEYGHRTFLEAVRFTSLLAAAGDADPMHALDYQVMQKVLPRLHGSHRRLMPVMSALGRFCLDPTEVCRRTTSASRSSILRPYPLTRRSCRIHSTRCSA